MKIGLVIPNSPGYSETFFISKIKGLQERGFDVRLYCQYKKGDFNLCPIVCSPKVISNPFLQGWYFLKAFLLLLPYLPTIVRYSNLERKAGTGLIQLLKKTYLNAHLLKAKLDWVHYGFATQAIGSENVAKAIGAKMAVSFRGFDIAIYPLKHPGCYNLLWEQVDKVHTISDGLLDKAYKMRLPQSVPVEKIMPAIDVNFFSCPSKSMALEHNQALKPTEPVRFLTVGRLHWKKGYVLMLEALAILKKKGIPFTYTIVGSGSKKERERIAFAALQLGIKEDVIFAGTLNREQVKKEYAKATIYLQYSISEGFCNAILEAQSMKNLCIVSNAEGLAENVLHGETGWVVPKLHPKLLAEQIEQVIKLSEEEKIQLTEYAADRVKNELSIEKQQAEFAAFYS